MKKHVLILVLTAFVARIHSHPLSIIFETGINSNATVKAEGKAGVESGWDSGPTLEGKARGEVSGSWLKNAFVKIGYKDSKGVPHGVGVSIGSVMDGKGVGEASAKAGTNLINTKVDKNAQVDGGASYKAGLNIHFLDKSDTLEVEGVNKQPNKTTAEADPSSDQSLQDIDQVNRNSKQVIEDPKQEGILKRTWNKYIG